MKRTMLCLAVLYLSVWSVGGQELEPVKEWESGEGADTSGKLIIPARYDNVGHFEKGQAGIVLDEKTSLIDTTGRLLIPTEYDGVARFKQGFADVKLDDK